jgi:hypothetical protein
MTQDIAIDAGHPILGEEWFDPLEAGVRRQLRSFIGDYAGLIRLVSGRPGGGRIEAEGKLSLVAGARYETYLTSPLLISLRPAA